MNINKIKSKKALKEKNQRKINKTNQYNYLIDSKNDEKYLNDNYKITSDINSNLKTNTLKGEHKDKTEYINMKNIIKKIDLSSYTMTSKEGKYKKFLQKSSKNSSKNKDILNYSIEDLINPRYKKKNKKIGIKIKLSLNNLVNIDNFNYNNNNHDLTNISNNRNTTNNNRLYKPLKIDLSKYKKEDKHIKNLISDINSKNKKVNKKFDELDGINLNLENMSNSKKNSDRNNKKFVFYKKVIKKDISLKKGNSSININTKIKKERKIRNKKNKSASIKKEIKHYIRHYIINIMDENLDSPKIIIKNNTKISSNRKLKKGNLKDQIPKPTKINHSIIVNSNKSYKNNKNKKIHLAKNFHLENKRHFSSEIMKKNIKLPILKLENENSRIKNEILKKNYLIDNALINIREFTIPGKTIDGKTKINQDTYVIQRDINYIKNFNIFAIFDGHGFNGQIISIYLKENLIKKFIEHPKIKFLKNLSDIYEQLIYNKYQIINELFQEIDDEILNNGKIFDVNLSGSTCILLLQIGDNIICANIGDSKAVIVYEDNKLAQINVDSDKYKIIKLSKDCTPHIKTEKLRILMNEGIIKQLKNDFNQELETLKIFIKGENIPGLNITRSFGDKIGKSIGVLSKPFINEYTLNKTVKYIVIASSGIWHFMKEKEIVDYGKEYYLMNDPDNFCKKIASISTELCKKNGGNIEDITLIVLFFTFI